MQGTDGYLGVPSNLVESWYSSSQHIGIVVIDVIIVMFYGWYILLLLPLLGSLSQQLLLVSLLIMILINLASSTHDCFMGGMIYYCYLY